MKRLTFLFIIPLFILACARITTPTGGPKDTIPPVLIKSYPKNGSTLVQDQKVILYFDETITLQNPKEEIIIVPTVGKEYEVKSKRNTVTIDLKKKLEDSTTYTISLRESIVDITEKNAPRNLKLAFSTGNYIDSLELSGKVFNLLTNKESEDVTIALYQSDTFNIFKHKPTYITKSDKKGKFVLPNIKNGEYFIYAFQDKNKNLIIDPKNESYGFKLSKLNLQKNIDTLKLQLIRLDTRPIKVSSAKPYNTYFNIKTTKALTSYTIKALEANPISAFAEENSIIKVYKTFTSDSLRINFTGTDSAQNKIDTVLYVKFIDKKVTPEKFAISIKNSTLIQNKGFFQTTIDYTKPLAQIITDSILIKLDSANNLAFTTEDFQIDSIHKKLIITKKFNKTLLQKDNPSPSNPSNTKKKINNQLYIGKGALISIENDSSQAYTENLKLLTPENTGVVLIKIETKAPHFILQLQDKNFTVIRTSADNKEIRFDNLLPGEYQLVMITDTNADGKWSPGNKFLNAEPEKITFYTNEKKETTFSLKANWELGPLLITDQ